MANASKKLLGQHALVFMENILPRNLHRNHHGPRCDEEDNGKADMGAMIIAHIHDCESEERDGCHHSRREKGITGRYLLRCVLSLVRISLHSQLQVPEEEHDQYGSKTHAAREGESFRSERGGVRQGREVLGACEVVNTGQQLGTEHGEDAGKGYEPRNVAKIVGACHVPQSVQHSPGQRQRGLMIGSGLWWTDAFVSLSSSLGSLGEDASEDASEEEEDTLESESESMELSSSSESASLSRLRCHVRSSERKVTRSIGVRSPKGMGSTVAITKRWLHFVMPDDH
ncbi:hypothetical protein GQ600_18489 [Phytophthora cactorum]|nr:hypothetical protein GQ600_18489 [Phytophthora cactorum]